MPLSRVDGAGRSPGLTVPCSAASLLSPAPVRASLNCESAGGYPAAIAAAAASDGANWVR
jgi:hypothetical protein